jgi:hypothetical protein
LYDQPGYLNYHPLSQVSVFVVFIRLFETGSTISFSTFVINPSGGM